jgi:hypothetical protein
MLPSFELQRVHGKSNANLSVCSGRPLATRQEAQRNQQEHFKQANDGAGISRPARLPGWLKKYVKNPHRVR